MAILHLGNESIDLLVQLIDSCSWLSPSNEALLSLRERLLNAARCELPGRTGLCGKQRYHQGFHEVITGGGCEQWTESNVCVTDLRLLFPTETTKKESP